jgi:hypothetical protein
LTCPICHKRKAKRFCPCKAENICSQCCGTEREVTIDCPSECPHLVASRRYDAERRDIDWSKAPFPETRMRRSFVNDHGSLFDALAYQICLYASDNRPLVDSDVQVAIQTLAETYRTLSSGIYYERPPEYLYQHELYESLKTAIDDYKKTEAQRLGLATIRDAEIRDCLIVLAQLCFTNSNGRPKGRAFLDLLRSQVKTEERVASASNLVVLP